MPNEPFVSTHVQTLQLNDWSSLSSGLVAGFTTRNGGVSEGQYQSLNLGLHVNDDASVVCANRKLLSNTLNFPAVDWVCAEQVHDNRIALVNRENCGQGVNSYDSSVKGTDGLYTFEKDILLALCFADCVPLYFHAPSKGLIGIAHAGWKGTVKDIAGEMVRCWESEGVVPSEIYAAIGPSVGKCCYIVDDYVIDFVKPLVGRNDTSCYKEKSAGQYMLDLRTLNFLLLRNAGIPEENIQITSHCTCCEDELFFSHRRDKGKTGRMLAFIGLKEVI